MHAPHIEIFSNPNAFSTLETAWEGLCNELADDVTVFASFIWYETWWRFYGAKAKLYLFTLWSENKLVGIAPLMFGKHTLRGLPLRTVGFLQNNQSLHNDFIVKPEFREFFFEKMLESLFQVSSSWDILYFRNMSSLSPNYQTLADILDSGGKSWYQNRNNIDSPFLVPEGTWGEFFSSRSTRARKSLRYIRNRVTASGNVSVRNFTTWEGYLSCREDLFAAAQQSWAEGGGDSLGSAVNRDFFELLAQKAAKKGWLSIWALYLNGRMIAVEFHLKAYGREHALRGHYVPEFASLSPGTFLEMHILKHVFEEPEKVNVYDFCGAFDQYKRKWTDASVPHCDLYVYQNKIHSRCAMLVEKVLVPGAKKAIRYAERFRRKSH